MIQKAQPEKAPRCQQCAIQGKWLPFLPDGWCCHKEHDRAVQSRFLLAGYDVQTLDDSETYSISFTETDSGEKKWTFWYETDEDLRAIRDAYGKWQEQQWREEIRLFEKGRLQ